MTDDPIDERGLVFGQVSPARAARLLAGMVIRTAPTEWTTEIVKQRLIEAIKGCERLVGNMRPRQAPGAWPSAELWGEAEIFDLNSMWEGAREGTRAPEGGPGGLNGFEVSRVEEAIAWPARYLRAERNKKHLDALNLWLWCLAKRQTWERECLGLTGHKATANRRRDRALEVICAGLKADKVPLKHHR